MSSFTHSINTHADWFAQPTRQLQVLGLLVLYFSVWLFSTPYAGLSHDAQGYALQALAKSDPAGLGQDIFLRYSSQDRFTVFPTLYAAVVRHMGIEPTAALSTFVLQAAWLASAFLIVRLLAGTRLALLALGLFITLPGGYGGQRVFHFAEPFLTARLPAEVVVLLALAACMSRRFWLCAVLASVAMVLHPLMAFPGVVLMLLLASARSRLSWLGPAAAASILVLGTLAGALVLGGQTAVVDPAWFAAIHSRSQHLFVEFWTIADWNQAVQTLITLVFALLACQSRAAKQIAVCALLLGLTGLLLTAVTSDWPLRIVLQGQPWRWMWLARFVAIGLLPMAVYHAWISGRAGQVCASLMAAAWLVVIPMSARSTVMLCLGSIIAGLAILAWVIRGRMTDAAVLFARRGAFAVLGIVLVEVVLISALAVALPAVGSTVARTAARLQSATSVISPAVLVVVVAWYTSMQSRHVFGWVLTVLAGLVLGVVAAPSAFAAWTQREFTGQVYKEFAPWRNAIPPSGEVFWWDGTRETWFLLGRRSYLTSSQGGGLVFSRDLMVELRRRADVTASYIDPGSWFNESPGPARQPHLTNSILNQLCSDPAMTHVVASNDVDGGGITAISPVTGQPVFLHDCASVRRLR